jgi:predicted SAM-dependent methyltransferase
MNLLDLFELGMDRTVNADTATPQRSGFTSSISLGGGSKKMPHGVTNIGFHEGWDADKDPLPYSDGEIDEIYALHFLEHVTNVNAVLAECQRVMSRFAIMNIVVPYGTCHMAVQDLDHKHFFNEDSWRHTFDNPYYNPHGTGWRFQIVYNVIMGVKGENLALVTQLQKK